MSFPYCSTRVLPYPGVSGAEIVSLSAKLVSNYSQSVHIGLFPSHGTINVVNTTFCNVSITYTYPPLNDSITVRVYLPQPELWNGRMQAVGGGGWQAGLNYPALSGIVAAASQGYASLSTDAGLGSAASPTEWPQDSFNTKLQNLASTPLKDAAIIGGVLSRATTALCPSTHTSLAASQCSQFLTVKNPLRL